MNEKTLEINTLCKDCVFAHFDNAGLSQYGCAFDRINKFRKTTKVEVEGDKFDYYRIHGFCNRCRDQEWANDKKNLIEDVIGETTISIGYVLIAEHDNQKLHISLKSLLEQDNKPVRIAVTFFDGQQNLRDFMRDIKGIETPIDIVNILDGNLDASYRKLEKSHYITLLKEGFILPSNFSSNLDKLINEDLMKISMIDGDNGYTIQTQLFTMLGGSFHEPLKDKIKKLAKIQNLEKMIIDYKEVINGK